MGSRLGILISGKQLGYKGEADKYHMLALHPDGETVYACNGGGLLGQILDCTTLNYTSGKGMKGFREPHGIRSAAYSPDGNLLAVGTDNGGVHVWDFSKGQKQLPKNGHSHYINTLSTSPDGRTVLSGGDDCAVRRWDVARPGESKLLYKSDQVLYHVAYSPNGKKYTTSASFWDDTGERGWVWDAATGERLFAVDPPEQGSDGDTFSPDGKVIAGFSRGCVLLWDANNGKELHQFPKMGSLAARPTFSTDGKLLAAATNDTKTVKVWDVASGEEVQSLQDDAPMPRGRPQSGRPAPGRRPIRWDDQPLGPVRQGPEETHAGRPLGPRQRLAVYAGRKDAGFFRRRRHDPPVEPGARGALCVS